MLFIGSKLFTRDPTRPDLAKIVEPAVTRVHLWFPVAEYNTQQGI